MLNKNIIRLLKEIASVVDTSAIAFSEIVSIPDSEVERIFELKTPSLMTIAVFSKIAYSRNLISQDIGKKFAFVSKIENENIVSMIIDLVCDFKFLRAKQASAIVDFLGTITNHYILKEIVILFTKNSKLKNNKRCIQILKMINDNFDSIGIECAIDALCSNDSLLSDDNLLEILEIIIKVEEEFQAVCVKEILAIPGFLQDVDMLRIIKMVAKTKTKYQSECILKVLKRPSFRENDECIEMLELLLSCSDEKISVCCKIAIASLSIISTKLSAIKIELIKIIIGLKSACNADIGNDLIFGTSLLEKPGGMDLLKEILEGDYSYPQIDTIKDILVGTDLLEWDSYLVVINILLQDKNCKYLDDACRIISFLDKTSVTDHYRVELIKMLMRTDKIDMFVDLIRNSNWCKMSGYISIIEMIMDADDGAVWVPYAIKLCYENWLGKISDPIKIIQKLASCSTVEKASAVYSLIEGHFSSLYEDKETSANLNMDTEFALSYFVPLSESDTFNSAFYLWGSDLNKVLKYLESMPDDLEIGHGDIVKGMK